MFVDIWGFFPSGLLDMGRITLHKRWSDGAVHFTRLIGEMVGSGCMKAVRSLLGAKDINSKRVYTSPCYRLPCHT